MNAIEFLEERRIYDDETLYNSADEMVGTLSDLMEEYAQQQLKNCNLQNVIHWVAIEDNNHPKQCTEVLVKFENGDVKCRWFDGDMRYYNVANDIDITDMITHWAALPE